jgi:hypothetical protein
MIEENRIRCLSNGNQSHSESSTASEATLQSRLSRLSELLVQDLLLLVQRAV